MSLSSRELVPVAPVREAFERSGLTKSQVASALGWVRPNIDRVNRALGYRPDTSSRGVRARPRDEMTLEHAMLFAEVLGADPVDFGF